MNYSKLTFGLLVVTLGLANIILGLANIANFDHQHQRNVLAKQYKTMEFCTYAERSGNFTICYDAQQLLHTEYLCNKDKMACWVEVK